MIDHVDLEFADGRIFRIPAIKLAKLRADHYATEIDGHARGSAEWEAEVNYVLNDDYEIVDYARNNLSWSDIEPLGKLIADPDKPLLEDIYHEANWEVS